MRIIAGKHRGRSLAAPPGLAVRPTADRTREALFNLLEHGRLAAEGSRVVGAVVLDAFAGTAAVALEALSRGAERATALESDGRILEAARANARLLGEMGRLTCVRADALAPPPAPGPADLIFLDPPYGRDLAGRALIALADAGWVAADAVVAVETGANETFAPPVGFALVEARRYGRAKLWLLTRGAGV